MKKTQISPSNFFFIRTVGKQRRMTCTGAGRREHKFQRCPVHLFTFVVYIFPRLPFFQINLYRKSVNARKADRGSNGIESLIFDCIKVIRWWRNEFVWSYLGYFANATAYIYNLAESSPKQEKCNLKKKKNRKLARNIKSNNNDLLYAHAFPWNENVV